MLLGAFPELIRTGWIGIYIGLFPTLGSIVNPNPNSETACKDEIYFFPRSCGFQHIFSVCSLIYTKEIYFPFS